MQNPKSYSKEYIEYAKLENTEPAFSIMEVYEKLEDGYTTEYKCDGFGFNFVLKHNNVCKLIYASQEKVFIVEFNDLVNYMKQKSLIND